MFPKRQTHVHVKWAAKKNPLKISKTTHQVKEFTVQHQLGQVISNFAAAKNGQVSSKFAAAKNGQDSSKFAAAKNGQVSSKFAAAKNGQVSSKFAAANRSSKQ